MSNEWPLIAMISIRIEFVNEFKVLTDTRKTEEPYGMPFAPEYVYDALRGRKRFDSMKVGSRRITASSDPYYIKLIVLRVTGQTRRRGRVFVFPTGWATRGDDSW